MEAELSGLGKRIRKARLARKMTQESLSEICGVNASYIGQVERGEKRPSLRKLVAICDCLGVDLSSLLQMDANPVDPSVQELVDVVSGCPAEVIRAVIMHARVVVETFTKLESAAYHGPSGGQHDACAHSDTTDS